MKYNISKHAYLILIMPKDAQQQIWAPVISKHKRKSVPLLERTN